jgi:DNA-binding protein HU-beta
MSLSKKDLIAKVAKEADETKVTVEKVTDAYHHVVKEELKAGNEIYIKGFGTYTNKTRSAREGRNPSTGKPIHIEEKKTIKFKIAQPFHDELNGIVKEKKVKEKKEEKEEK